MAEKSTFIKIDRNILKWGWYTEPLTAHLFIYLILSANITDKTWHGIPVKRGELITSYKKLSQHTGLSVQEVRTALNHLKSTHEITQSSTPKYTVITILNYDTYQKSTRSSTNNQHGINTVPTNSQQQLKNIKNNKNISKDIKNSSERAAFEADALAAGYVDAMGNPDLDAYLAHIEELRNS